MTNHTLDSSTVFGRMMLVFFWNGLAVIITIFLNRFIAFTVFDALLFNLGMNIFLVWLKDFMFRTFNK